MTYNKKPNGCTWIPKQPQEVELCCITHDVAYICQTGKIKADLKLFMCLWRKGYKFRAIIFTSAILVFGYYFYYNREIKALWKKILK